MPKSYIAYTKLGPMARVLGKYHERLPQPEDGIYPPFEEDPLGLTKFVYHTNLYFRTRWVGRKVT